MPLYSEHPATSTTNTTVRLLPGNDGNVAKKNIVSTIAT